MKYRIIKKVYNIGEPKYIPQKRYWGVWIYFKAMHQGGGTYVIAFSTLEDAKREIENDRVSNQKRKSKSSEVIKISYIGGEE